MLAGVAMETRLGEPTLLWTSLALCTRHPLSCQAVVTRTQRCCVEEDPGPSSWGVEEGPRDGRKREDSREGFCLLHTANPNSVLAFHMVP